MMTLNTAEFREFKSKREQWIECFNGKDEHSIVTQISWMLWNAGAYRIIDEARRIAEPADDGGVQLNWTMHGLIDDGFLISQTVAIRRLKDTYNLTGPKSVYSLTGLLKDMQRNIHLMTRENILAAEGLEYDYAANEQALHEYFARQTGSSHLPSHFERCLNSKNRHKDIDRLAGVDQATRSRNDCIHANIFDHLWKKVDKGCSTVIECVNKYIAHAATPESRATVKVDRSSVTLEHLWNAHEIICNVAGFLDLKVLTETSHYFLRTSPFNKFAYINRPLVTEENIGLLADEWEKYDNETQEWSGWGLDELEAEMQ